MWTDAWTEKILEKGLVPDPLVRFQIRRLLRRRLREERRSELSEFIRMMRSGPLAIETQAANAQHYEVPAAFFERVLGPRLKYSCALFGEPNESLGQAEERMLALTCERAELNDSPEGQDILELGCGWGSLTLWMAEKYPRSRITGVSNSASQREFILARAKRLGLGNVEILTCDMNRFEPTSRYDRVVSVEMFEHMRNTELLFARIGTWLKEGGKLFVHVFSHREYAYLFEDRDGTDWMARHFFTGGMMPSHALYGMLRVAPLEIEREWVVSGEHYSRTAELWLSNMDAHRGEIRRIFSETYGVGTEELWWSRWRVFFMACAELWGWKGGSEWQVSHYLFGRSGKTDR